MRTSIAVAVLVVLAALVSGACAPDDADHEATPTSTSYAGPGELRTIASGTQMHLDGVAIGVGNIWDEEYVPTGGTPVVGLTALLFISPTDETIANSTVRVHPGQEVDVPGYRLHVVSVEPGLVRLAVDVAD